MEITSRYVCTLLLLALPLTSASVLQRSSAEDSLHRETRAAGCNIPDGRVIASGTNFTRTDTGPCVTYICQDGNVLPLDYGCYRDGVCYPLKDVHKLGCLERTCQLFNGRFDYVISREACTSRDQRSCIDVGSTVKDGCFTYRCDKEEASAISVSYHLRNVGVGCDQNGQCVPINHTLTQGCRTLQCQQRVSAVGFFTLKDGCEIQNQCVDVGETVVNDCRTFACSKENINGLNVLSIKPTKIQCKDANDVCHDSGTYFPIEVNHNNVNCTCEVRGLNIEYTCPECKDADGVCHEGGEWFPLLVDDKDRVNCTCHVTGFNIAISCPSIGLNQNFGG